MSRRDLAKKKRQTTVTIPERVGPHVKLVFAEMRRLNYTYGDIEYKSGVIKPTIKAWRYKNRPSLDNIEAVLNVLGYDYLPIPRAEIIPPDIERHLKPLAVELGLTMPQAVQALIEIVTAIHTRPTFEPIERLKPEPPPRRRRKCSCRL